MTDVDLTLLYGIYTLALILVGLRLYSKKKRDFLLASLVVLLGSIYTFFTLSFSVLTYFLLAMVFSFIGDVLMAETIKMSDQRIVDGAIAFGIGHIFYIVGFYQLNLGGYTPNLWWMIPLGLILSASLYYVIAYNPEFHPLHKFVHIVYSLLIGAVFISVLGFVIRDTVPLTAILVAIPGILLFMISDGILAYNEFKKELPRAKDIIALTYILAQILLQLTPVMTLNV